MVYSDSWGIPRYFLLGCLSSKFKWIKPPMGAVNIIGMTLPCTRLGVEAVIIMIEKAKSVLKQFQCNSSRTTQLVHSMLLVPILAKGDN